MKDMNILIKLLILLHLWEV